MGHLHIRIPSSYPGLRHGATLEGLYSAIGAICVSLERSRSLTSVAFDCYTICDHPSFPRSLHDEEVIKQLALAYRNTLVRLESRGVVVVLETSHHDKVYRHGLPIKKLFREGGWKGRECGWNWSLCHSCRP